jgi:mono/diheme cytochrome c family protein
MHQHTLPTAARPRVLPGQPPRPEQAGKHPPRIDAPDATGRSALPRRLALAVAGLGVALALTACGGGSSSPPASTPAPAPSPSPAPAPVTGDPARGRTLWTAQVGSQQGACAQCHGSVPSSNIQGIWNASGTANDRGNPAVISAAISRNTGGMGQFNALTAQQVADIAAYVNAVRYNKPIASAEPPASGVPTPPLAARSSNIGLRRLTKAEMVNSARDLFGADVLAGVPLPESSLVNSLSNNQHVQQIARADLESFERAADTAATRALPALKLPSGCSSTAMPGDCIDRFLPGFLERAWRRPATAAEIKRLKDFYTAQAADGVSEALRAVLQATLMSPHWLYRGELGGADGKLTPHELASRLSYLLWGSMPDDALLTAAKNNQLATADQVKAQVTRMLADARARQGVTQFARDWLGTARADVMRKGAELRAGLSDASLQADLEAEHNALIADTLLTEGGSVKNLLSARFTYVTANGARLLGLPAVSTLTKVSTDGQPRRGVLTQPLLLAAHSKEAGASVVQMGRFVRENLLCQPVLPPPAGVDTTIPNDPATANLSYREKLTRITSPANCVACHATLNPPGFAYLSYDPLGRYLAKDGKGNVLDTTGSLTEIDGKALAFLNAPEMIDGLAASTEVKACFARRFIEYGFGRTIDAADLPLYRSLATRLAERDHFADLVTSLVLAPEFGAVGPRKP